MKRLTTRVLALTLALTLTAALSACVDTPENAGESGGPLFQDDVALSLVVASDAQCPYNADWKAWGYLKEAVGGNLTVSAIPSEAFDEQVSLMLASPATRPDLLYLSSKALVNEHAASGAFIAIDDHLEKLPNYKAFVNSLDSTVRSELLAQRSSGDGKIYFPPACGPQTVSELYAWAYRKDVFEKNGLEPPRTLKELYTVCKTLKERYPDAYPFCVRGGIRCIDLIGPTFDNNFATALYYDFKGKEWLFGAQEDTMQEVIRFFVKMRDDGLLPPDYLTMTDERIDALLAENRVFILPEAVVRVADADEWAFFEPPAGSGVHRIARRNVDTTGYVVCDTEKEDRIANAFKLVDWMYTDEACKLLSWGREGETYAVENGKKHFLLDDGEDLKSKYGFGTCGLYQRIDPETVLTNGEEIEAEVGEYLENNVNPVLWLPLTKEESARAATLGSALQTYTDKALTQFLLGERSLDDWEIFQDALTDLGVEELIEIYEDAWERVMG